MNAKEIMIEKHIKGRGIKDKKLLKAFDVIDRKAFIDAADYPYAYDDFPLKIGEGQTISQPFMVAFMSDVLNLKPTDTVLEIGTGSGFQTGILAYLCKHVDTVERHLTLQEKAKNVLTNVFNLSNITFIHGDGTKSISSSGSYEKIMVTAATKKIPETLLNQLKNGGRMVIPIGSPFIQTLTLVEKKDDHLLTKKLLDCRFVPLIED